MNLFESLGVIVVVLIAVAGWAKIMSKLLWR